MLDTNLSSGTRPLHPVLVRLFKKRDLSPEEVQELFSWDLKSLPDLTDLQDLDKAALRVIQALDKEEKIAIYGDYDVDGTTSCALLYHFFKLIGVEVFLMQPDRFIEGYGLHLHSIDQALDNKVDLMITVDCGISNFEAAEYAKKRGLDLIITDHHKDALPNLPPAYAVVNPNRRDEPENSPLRFLAGVGVAFSLALKIRTELLSQKRECPGLYPLLPFLAIGTLCDLVPLNAINLRLCRHGLKALQESQYPGLRVFLTPEEKKQTYLASDIITFRIGPMINSKGRLDHPRIALELLISDDIDEAYHKLHQLESSNNERKKIQAEVFKEAREQIIDQINQHSQSEDWPISIAFSPNWHEGVIGIVASKLVEEFKAPAIVLTKAEQEGILKGSCRTAGELSIFDLLHDHREYFLKFGGHKAAAGLSLEENKFDEFKKHLFKSTISIPTLLRRNQDHFDLDIELEEVTPQLLEDLERWGPYGTAHQLPVFRMRQFKLHSFDILKDLHVRWHFVSLKSSRIQHKGISFNYLNRWETPHPQELFRLQEQEKEPLTAYFTLAINSFRGNKYIQFMVQKIVPDAF